VTTSTASVHHQSSVQLYNDVHLAAVSQASSLSAVYRSSVVSQQVNACSDDGTVLLKVKVVGCLSVVGRLSTGERLL